MKSFLIGVELAGLVIESNRKEDSKELKVVFHGVESPTLHTAEEKIRVSEYGYSEVGKKKIIEGFGLLRIEVTSFCLNIIC